MSTQATERRGKQYTYHSRIFDATLSRVWPKVIYCITCQTLRLRKRSFVVLRAMSHPQIPKLSHNINVRQTHHTFYNILHSQTFSEALQVNTLKRNRHVLDRLDACMWASVRLDKDQDENLRFLRKKRISPRFSQCSQLRRTGSNNSLHFSGTFGGSAFSVSGDGTTPLDGGKMTQTLQFLPVAFWVHELRRLPTVQRAVAPACTYSQRPHISRHDVRHCVGT